MRESIIFQVANVGELGGVFIVSCELSEPRGDVMSIGKLTTHLAPTDSWWNTCGGVKPRVIALNKCPLVVWICLDCTKKGYGIVPAHLRISSIHKP